MCCIHPPRNSSLKQAKLNPQGKGGVTIVKSEYMRWGWKKQREEIKGNTRNSWGGKRQKDRKINEKYKRFKKKSWGLQ